EAHRALAGIIGGNLVVADHAHDRAQVDDAGAAAHILAACRHHRHEMLGAEEHAIDIDRHDPPPAFHRQAFDRPGEIGAGIVDEDVEPAVTIAHKIARALPVALD